MKDEYEDKYQDEYMKDEYTWKSSPVLRNKSRVSRSYGVLC